MTEAAPGMDAEADLVGLSCLDVPLCRLVLVPLCRLVLVPCSELDALSCWELPWPARAVMPSLDMTEWLCYRVGKPQSTDAALARAQVRWGCHGCGLVKACHC